METSHLQMLQGVPKKGDSCLMTSKDLNILDTDKYSERKIYKLKAINDIVPVIYDYD